jgi:hypothetical protein
MSATRMESLSDQARLWIFPADRPLQPEEVGRLQPLLDRFVGEWTAHKVRLEAAAAVLDHQFIAVAVDEGHEASGCSIDALFRFVSQIEREIGVRLLDSSLLFIRRDGQVEALDRSAFRQRAAAGEITAETEVVDTTVERLEAVRKGEWLRRAGESWHRSLLPASASA